MSEISAIQKHYDVSRTLAQMLLMLARKTTVTSSDLEASVKSGKVAIHRLRNSVGGHGISIKSRRDVGYWLSEEDQAKVLAVAAMEQDDPGGGGEQTLDC